MKQAKRPTREDKRAKFRTVDTWITAKQLEREQAETQRKKQANKLNEEFQN